VEDFVRLGIDSNKQPAALVVDPNHGLVERDVIRGRVDGRLEIGFLDPAIIGGATALVPNLSRYCLVFESNSLAGCN